MAKKIAPDQEVELLISNHSGQVIRVRNAGKIDSRLSKIAMGVDVVKIVLTKERVDRYEELITKQGVKEDLTLSINQIKKKDK